MPESFGVWVIWIRCMTSKRLLIKYPSRQTRCSKQVAGPKMMAVWRSDRVSQPFMAWLSRALLKTTYAIADANRNHLFCYYETTLLCGEEKVTKRQCSRLLPAGIELKATDGCGSRMAAARIYCDHDHACNFTGCEYSMYGMRDGKAR